MKWNYVFTITAIAVTQVNALLRFACSQLVVERFDPLVTPGIVSPHVHQIVGGNAFDIAMNPANDLPSMSTCTTCTFTEDFSNYWTAVLYFRHRNGTFERVPQIPEQLIGPANGGITVYYSQPSNGAKVTAFKKGFRMIVGDPMLRTLNANASNSDSNYLNYRCLAADDSNGGPVASTGTSSKTFFTDRKCVGGVRAEATFPSCWDGVNLDMPDHKSYEVPSSGRMSVLTPRCRPFDLLGDRMGYRLTAKFSNLWDPTRDGNPFVWSMGDPTGYGQHADYVFGWEGDSLQRAMDTCLSYGGPCPTLKTQTIEQANKCSQKNRVREPVDGLLSALPGCNPIQPGPAQATLVPNCNATKDYDADGGPPKRSVTGRRGVPAMPATT